MKQETLENILYEHRKWVVGNGGSRADLSGANLRGADLSWANLRWADLRGAYLYGADLSGANLSGANLRGANLPHFSIVPETGSFRAYKKVDTGVIELIIPPFAKRTSSLVGRKCRAEFAYVIKGSGTSSRGGVYEEGKTYYPDSFDDDIRVECSHGVHFFMTKREAEEF
jgi:hypothetical protein